MNLKNKLQALQNNDLATLTPTETEALLEEFLANMGHPDPQLRDSLIYSTFVKIFQANLLSENQWHHVVKHCLSDQGLYHHLGDTNSDTVFTRSFSALFLVVSLIADSQTPFLSQDQFGEVLHKTTRYFQQELDVRGFVPQKGWAHAIAHGADLLGAVASHPKFEAAQSEKILAAIQNFLLSPHPSLKDQEEIRLAATIPLLLDKGLSITVLTQWLEALFNGIEALDYGDSFYSEQHYTAWQTRYNVINFLKAVYFKLKETYPDVAGVAYKLIKNHV